MSLELRVTHIFWFTSYAEDDWPDTVPWPEWKPGTEKSMRPTEANFSVRVSDNGKPDVSKVNVTGPRVNKNGDGAGVDNDYYLSAKSTPDFVRDLVSDALETVKYQMSRHLDDDS